MILSRRSRATLKRKLLWLKEGKYEVERWRYRLASARRSPRAHDGGRPNVVFLSVDSMGAKHLGCYGYDRPTSPSIDALAQGGVLFENARSQTNWTKPSLSSMLTGLYPSVHKTDVRDEAGDRVEADRPQQANVLSSRFRTIAQEFKDGGYVTGGFSNGGYAHSSFGYSRGFDSYDDRGGGIKSCLYRLLRWALRSPDRPFFAFVHAWDAHFPYLDRRPYNRMFVRKRVKLVLDGRTRARINRGARPITPDEGEFLRGLFDGSVRYVDRQVGAFISELRRLGVLDRTILVITADHGEAFLEHGRIEHTPCLYDEVLRVPLILHGPGLPAGRRIGAQVRSIDVMPTLLELCGLAPKGDIQGVSLLDWIRGERNDPLVSVSETQRAGGQQAISDGRYKLIRFDTDARVELYDLLDDPGERHDLAATATDVGARLESLFQAWGQEIDRYCRHYWSESGGADREDLSPEVIRRLQDLGYLA